MSKHTLGPWLWTMNLTTKRLQLLGGVPKYDLIVMDFVRWGMNGAAPRFNTELRTNLNVMEPAHKFGKIVAGREHHADWFQVINHPDALLMQAAPDLLAACELARDRFSRLNGKVSSEVWDGNYPAVAALDAAIDKAAGQSAI